MARGRSVTDRRRHGHQAGDHPGGHAVGQAERIADRDDGGSHIGTSAERGGHDDLGQLRRDERGDVQLRVGGGDSRVRRDAVGERDGNGPAAHLQDGNLLRGKTPVLPLYFLTIPAVRLATKA